MQQRWEHYFASFSREVFGDAVKEAQLQADDFAQQGWELVNTSVTPQLNEGRLALRYLFVLAFKRPVE